MSAFGGKADIVLTYIDVCFLPKADMATSAAGVSPDDLMITLYEAPGENFSFGRGEAQRANAVLS